MEIQCSVVNLRYDWVFFSFSLVSAVLFGRCKRQQLNDNVKKLQRIREKLIKLLFIYLFHPIVYLFPPFSFRLISSKAMTPVFVHSCAIDNVSYNSFFFSQLLMNWWWRCRKKKLLCVCCKYRTVFDCAGHQGCILHMLVFNLFYLNWIAV